MISVTLVHLLVETSFQSIRKFDIDAWELTYLCYCSLKVFVVICALMLSLEWAEDFHLS